MIQDLSGSWCIKGTGESTLVMDSPVLLMHHDPDRSWTTNPDPDHPKGTHPLFTFGGNPANVDCVTIGYCTKYMYVELLTFCKVSKATWTFPRGDTGTKGTGMLVPNFGKKPLKGIKILFCGRGLNFFPLRGGKAYITQ